MLRPMVKNPLPSSLAAVRDELDETTKRMHRLLDTMDEPTWGRSPESGKWSVARCIEHLNLTSRAYVPVLQAAFWDARKRGVMAKDPSYRMDLWGWLLLKSVDERARFKMKTPEPFVPPTIEPKEKVIREYDELQNELVALLEDSADLALGKIVITSPFNANIKYNAYSAYRIIAAHQRRHLGQAEHVFTSLATRFVKM